MHALCDGYVDASGDKAFESCLCLELAGRAEGLVSEADQAGRKRSARGVGELVHLRTSSPPLVQSVREIDGREDTGEETYI